MKKTPKDHLLASDDFPLDEIPLSEHPRPQFQRPLYQCLNGIWELAITRENAPSTFSQQINVPYPVESLLSGITRPLAKGEKLFYRRLFSLDKAWQGQEVILHLDGVDQKTKVYINDHLLGEHHDGYLPFSFNITAFLTSNNVLLVEVEDDLDYDHGYGKQSHESHGMWYTKTSGIWKSVWLEGRPTKHIEGMKITPSLDHLCLEVINSKKVSKTIIIQTEDGLIKHQFDEEKLWLPIANPHLWSPEDPYLYHFELVMGEDHITSYFALRTIGMGTSQGSPCLLLNEKPYFFHGLLDQGYFSDGLYTPKNYQKYAEDILIAKRLGFNTLRKHIKIEPLYFYYLCDKLGMIVFQDLVNHDRYHFFRETFLPTIGLKKWRNYGRSRRQEMQTNFKQHMRETLSLLYNSPSVVYYTIFNEGWGQFRADEMYALAKSIDSSRIIDATSGWFWGHQSDVDSHHVYFKKFHLRVKDRPVILSEFGGYACPIPGHCFRPDRNYGYRKYQDLFQYESDVQKLYAEQIAPWVLNGLAGAIYTQLSDVEEETNGVCTFDRQIVKLTKPPLAIKGGLLEEYSLKKS